MCLRPQTALEGLGACACGCRTPTELWALSVWLLSCLASDGTPSARSLSCSAPPTAVWLCGSGARSRCPVAQATAAVALA